MLTKYQVMKYANRHAIYQLHMQNNLCYLKPMLLLAGTSSPASAPKGGNHRTICQTANLTSGVHSHLCTGKRFEEPRTEAPRTGFPDGPGLQDWLGPPLSTAGSTSSGSGGGEGYAASCPPSPWLQVSLQSDSQFLEQGPGQGDGQRARCEGQSSGNGGFHFCWKKNCVEGWFSGRNAASACSDTDHSLFFSGPSR